MFFLPPTYNCFLTLPDAAHLSGSDLPPSVSSQSRHLPQSVALPTSPQTSLLLCSTAPTVTMTSHTWVFPIFSPFSFVTYWYFVYCHSVRLTGYWSLKDAHNLIPTICVYVTWHGKRDSAGVIKLTALKWIISLSWSQCNHRSLNMEERGWEGSEGCNVRRTQAADSIDEQQGTRAKDVGQLQDDRRGKKIDCPL